MLKQYVSCFCQLYKKKFEKYKIVQKSIEKDQSLKEIEEDIKKLKKSKQ